MRRGRLLLPGVAVAAAVAIAAVAWHRHETRVAWAIAVPAAPDLAALPAAMQTRVGALTGRAAQRDVAALGELGRLYHANGFSREAALAYNGLLRFDPANPRWPHLLAHLLAGHGQLGEAAALWQRAVQLAPDYLPARLRCGEALLKTNDVDGAAEVYATAVAAAPRDAHALVGHARCEWQRGRLTAARERLQQAVAAQPDFGAAWHLLATVYERLGNSSGAAAARARAEGLKRFREMSDPWLDELLDDCLDPYRLRVAAATRQHAGDAGGARPLLERAVQLAPDDATALRELGKLCGDMHDVTRARAVLARAVHLAPADEFNHLELFAVCNAAGDDDAAASVLQAGLSACPNSAGLHFAHGRWLLAHAREDEALQAWLEATRLQPETPDAWREIATLHFRRGRDEAGMSTLARFLDFRPDHAETITALARRAIEIGDEVAATRWLERLRKRSDGDALSGELAGEFSRRFGRAP